ncbi:hypothetical protein [Mycobacterium sp. GA-1285]|uniref:hypothetical protein n=1 Tax=Mycobacterium sp. GA-1285 TaxID=1772282 RepID=UPI001C12ADB6|nr:hypothetical protein [Mycobacterium sp. GA-1285]
MREAVGPWKVVTYHESYAIAGKESVQGMPGGRAWCEALESVADERDRHLLTYEGHVTHLTDRDRALLDHAPDGLTVIGSADEIRAHLSALSHRGVHEVIYTPSGPDLARELEAFAAARN